MSLAYVACAGILNNLWGLETELEQGCRTGPARLYSLAELVPWNRFLGSLKVKNSGSGGPVRNSKIPALFTIECILRRVR